jgi:hypothetical protein
LFRIATAVRTKTENDGRKLCACVLCLRVIEVGGNRGPGLIEGVCRTFQRVRPKAQARYATTSFDHDFHLFVLSRRNATSGRDGPRSLPGWLPLRDRKALALPGKKTSASQKNRPGRGGRKVTFIMPEKHGCTLTQVSTTSEKPVAVTLGTLGQQRAKRSWLRAAIERCYSKSNCWALAPTKRGQAPV